MVCRGSFSRARGTSARCDDPLAIKFARPEAYGVIEFDAHGRAIRIIEKAEPLSLAMGSDRALFLRQLGDRKIAAGLKTLRALASFEISDVKQCSTSRRELPDAGETWARGLRLVRYRHPTNPSWRASEFVRHDRDGARGLKNRLPSKRWPITWAYIDRERLFETWASGSWATANTGGTPARSHRRRPDFRN